MSTRSSLVRTLVSAALAVAMVSSVSLVSPAYAADALDPLGTLDPDAPTSSSPSATQPPTVSIPVRTVDTPGRGGQNGTIVMRVGRSAPIRVIIDTGFSGLVLFPGAGAPIRQPRVFGYPERWARYADCAPVPP